MHMFVNGSHVVHTWDEAMKLNMDAHMVLESC